ncbi:MAG: hypothetical protein HYU63_00665 [Armatimonadetes bacterium]|nr:hypothetical protein [Armatimonadota bacterium]
MHIILSMIEQEVAYKGIMTSLGIKKGGIEIVETLITKESPALNRTLKELNTPSDCLIAGVIRNDNWLIPDGNTVIQVNDMLITLIKKEKFNALKNILMG